MDNEDMEKLSKFVTVDENIYEECYSPITDKNCKIFDEFLVLLLRMPENDKNNILEFLDKSKDRIVGTSLDNW